MVDFIVGHDGSFFQELSIKIIRIGNINYLQSLIFPCSYKKIVSNTVALIEERWGLNHIRQPKAYAEKQIDLARHGSCAQYASPALVSVMLERLDVSGCERFIAGLVSAYRSDSLRVPLRTTDGAVLHVELFGPCFQCKSHR